MTHPLELSRARIDRAREHFDAVVEAVASLTSVPREIPDIAAQLRYPKPQRPQRVCMMVGEIVYSLRTGLDHLVWGLASRSGQLTALRVGFPVCDSHEQFKQVAHGGMLKGVPRKFYPLIAGAQPYLAPEPRNAVLRLLEDIAIADAHDGIPLSLVANPDSGGLALVFDRIGSYDDAPVLPVLTYLRTGVEGIVASFEKCF